jgi:hypothetical protein
MTTTAIICARCTGYRAIASGSFCAQACRVLVVPSPNDDREGDGRGKRKDDDDDDDDDENDRDVALGVLPCVSSWQNKITINMWWDGRRRRGQGMEGKGGGEWRGRGEDDGLCGPWLHGGGWYDDREGWHGETGAA